MPAVINVGGPVAWGLVVLLSAWAVRAGRALAGRRRQRRDEDEDALLHDPNAPQPRHLQRLSATAIRMLIETGALPCAILELADGSTISGAAGGCYAAAAADGRRGDGGGARGSCGPPGSRAGAAATTAAAGATGGVSGAPASAGGPAAPSRIVPPELAAAVPCLPAAAWVRAIASHEAWRAELTRAAAAASAVRSSHGGSSAMGVHNYSYSHGGLLPPANSNHALQQQQQQQSRDAGTAASLAAPHQNGNPLLLQQQQQSQAQPRQQSGAPSPRHPQQQSNPSTAGMASGGHLGTRLPEATPGWEPPGPSDRISSGGLGSSSLPSLRFSQQHQQLLLQSVTSLTGVCVTDGWRGPGSAAAAAAATMASLPYPSRHALLVVLGRQERVVAAVTAAAAAAGYSRVGVWCGPAESFAATSLGGPRLPSVSRDALWLMLQLGPDPLFHVPSLVLDVRRPDERLSYGAIRGTVNVPADELAAALELPAAEFHRRYGVPPPAADDVVVLMSRSGRRAAWAAQLCVDAGLKRVFVYGEGVYGWRLEDRVKPYRAYDLGALPPEPEPFVPEEADEAAGLEELHALGLSMRQGPRPSRFEAPNAPAAAAACAHPTATGHPGIWLNHQAPSAVGSQQPPLAAAPMLHAVGGGAMYGGGTGTLLTPGLGPGVLHAGGMVAGLPGSVMAGGRGPLGVGGDGGSGGGGGALGGRVRGSVEGSRQSRDWGRAGRV